MGAPNIQQGARSEDLYDANQRLRSGYDQQQYFLNSLQAVPGGMASQGFLANQLMQQAQGGGPNPALAQLANTTGQNIKSQAALMGSVRGGGNNPGLLARNIGMMGAQQQQQAGGQAAVLAAQQQLAAQQGLQNLAAQQVGQQQNAMSTLGNMGLQNQAQQLGGVENQNQSRIGAAKESVGNKILGGVTNAIGAIPEMLAQGGSVPSLSNYFAQGGKVPVMLSPGEVVLEPGAGVKKVPGKAKVSGDSYQNDTVFDELKPGSIVVPKSKVNDPAKAQAFVEAILNKKRI